MARCPPSHGSCPGSSLLRRARAALRGGGWAWGLGPAKGRDRRWLIDSAGGPGSGGRPGRVRAGRRRGTVSARLPQLRSASAPRAARQLSPTRALTRSHAESHGHTASRTPCHAHAPCGTHAAASRSCRVTHTFRATRTFIPTHTRPIARALHPPGEARQLSRFRCFSQLGHTPSASHVPFHTPGLSHSHTHSL